MKKPLLLLFVLLLCAGTQDVYALYYQGEEQGPGKKMSFQGTLYENGEPVNGNRTFTFTIGLDEGDTWTETQADVLVVEGLYSVTLGSVNPLPADLFFNVEERTLTVAIGSTTLGSTTLYAPFAVNSAGEFMLNSVNPEDSMAVNAHIYGAGTNPYNMAVRGLASTDLSNTGVGGIAEGSDINEQFQTGVVGNAYSNNTSAWATGTWGTGFSYAGGVAYGMRGEVYGSGADFSAAARGLNHMATVNGGVRYGGFFDTRANAEGAVYPGRSVGTQGTARGSEENIGIFGMAVGQGENVTNWSGWFEAAPVTLRAQPLQIHGPDGNLKVDLNYYEPNNSGSLVIHGHNNTRRTILGAASEGTIGFLGLYDSLDVNRVNIRAYNGNGYMGLAGENSMNVEMGAKYWEEGGLDKGYFKIQGNGYVPEGSEEEQVHDLIFMDASYNEPTGLEFGRMETKNQMGQQMSMLDMNDQGAGRFQLMSPDGYTNTLIGSNGPKAGLINLNDSLGRATYRMLSYAQGSAYEEMSAGIAELGETRVVWQLAGYQSPWTNMIGRNDDGSSKGRVQSGWLAGSDNPAFRITSGDNRWLVNLEGGAESGARLALEGPNSSNIFMGGKDWENNDLPYLALRGYAENIDGAGNPYTPDLISLHTSQDGSGNNYGEFNIANSNDVQLVNIGARAWEDNGINKAYINLSSDFQEDDGNGGFYNPALFSANVNISDAGVYSGDINLTGSAPTGIRMYGAADFEGDGSNVHSHIALDGTNDNHIFLDGTGNGDFTGSVNAFALNQTSDARLKKNVVTLTSGLAMVTQLRGVRYNWKDENRPEARVGFIAQEVEEVLPELVTTKEDGFKAVNYAEMTAVLVEAVKELNQQIADLKKENGQLKAELSKVEDMESRLAQIEALLQGTSKTVNTDQK